MEAMPLRAALDVAVKFAHPKALKGFNAVVLSPGRVRASDGQTAGVDIPCPEVTVDAVVDCTALRKMVSAIGGVKLSIGKVKADKGRLIIEGAGSRYTLATVTDPPAMPALPEAGWASVAADHVRAVAAMARMASSPDVANFALSGLRLHTQWTGSATTSYLVVAWVGVVSDPVTVPSGIWEDLGGEVEVLRVREGGGGPGKLWLREVRSGQVRWANGLSQEWPDESVNLMLSGARATDGGPRLTVEVDPTDLGALAKQADVVADAGAVFRLTLDKTGLTLAGAGTGAVSDFSGVCGLKAPSPAVNPITIGVSPMNLAKVAEALGSVAGDRKFLTMAPPVDGRPQPVVLWGGEPVVVEALCTPRHLD